MGDRYALLVSAFKSVVARAQGRGRMGAGCVCDVCCQCDVRCRRDVRDVRARALARVRCV